MTIQLTIYIANDYTIDYTRSQMTIQLTIHIANDDRLYTYDYTIDLYA